MHASDEEHPAHPEIEATRGFSKRILLASAGALTACAVFGWRDRAHAQSSDALAAWIGASVVPIRTVDPHAEDFSDLEPLADFIGSARVVQLGEPSHGAGTCFSAKVRLVKFLHQRLGFDVLAWESGFFDVERTEAGLRAGDDPVAAARRGVLQLWSASAECRPLFEYARQSHAGFRPLVMAGFDMQFTSPEGFSELSSELRSFVAAVSDTDLRAEATRAANEAIQAFDDIGAYARARSAYVADLRAAGTSGSAIGEALAAWDRDTGAELRPRREALDRLNGGVDRLLRLFDDHPALFAATGGERRRGFMARAVANLGGFGANNFGGVSAESFDIPLSPVAGENRRDALMAENLRWLIGQGYPGRKVIVWAHNAHVMNAYYVAPDFKTIRLDPVPDAMKPMGVFLVESFGSDVYTIGFTAHQGRDEWLFNPGTAMTIPPAAEDSIEGRLHRLGRDYGFLDFRASRGIADHPLAQPQRMRVPKYDEVRIADATRPYDAIFYIERMAPPGLVG